MNTRSDASYDRSVRSVWFLLFDATVGEAEACLERAGFEQLQPERQWNYPPGSGVVLYARCDPYDPSLDPEEHQRIQRWSGGRSPTASIHIDVSGRSPGDTEVRHAAEAVLSRFDGLAFDDYTSREHGWTLAEIRNGAAHDGLRFFDYEHSRETPR